MGLGELWDQLVDCICRPPRDDGFSVEDLVGGLTGRFKAMRVEGYREDLVLPNKSGARLMCSHFLPKGVKGRDDRLPCVIYCHCNSGSRRDAEEAICVLIPMGVSVFTMDFMGSGLSDGSWVTLGCKEVDDVEVAVEHLRSTGRVSTLALWGRSMGAVTALLYSQRDPSIAGIVLDSPFSRLTDLILEIVEDQKLPIPRPFCKLAVAAMRRSVRKRADFDISQVAPIDVVPRSFIPALFGHATADKFIRIAHSEKLHAAYAGDKNLIRFEGDHNSRRPDFFYHSVSIFLHNTLRLDTMVHSAPPSLPEVAEAHSHAGGTGAGAAGAAESGPVTWTAGDAHNESFVARLPTQTSIGGGGFGAPRVSAGGVPLTEPHHNGAGSEASSPADNSALLAHLTARAGLMADANGSRAAGSSDDDDEALAAALHMSLLEAQAAAATPGQPTANGALSPPSAGTPPGGRALAAVGTHSMPHSAEEEEELFQRALELSMQTTHVQSASTTTSGAGGTAAAAAAVAAHQSAGPAAGIPADVMQEAVKPAKSAAHLSEAGVGAGTAEGGAGEGPSTSPGAGSVPPASHLQPLAGPSQASPGGSVPWASSLMFPIGPTDGGAASPPAGAGARSPGAGGVAVAAAVTAGHTSGDSSGGDAARAWADPAAPGAMSAGAAVKRRSSTSGGGEVAGATGGVGRRATVGSRPSDAGGAAAPVVSGSLRASFQSSARTSSSGSLPPAAPSAPPWGRVSASGAAAPAAVAVEPALPAGGSGGSHRTSGSGQSGGAAAASKRVSAAGEAAR